MILNQKKPENFHLKKSDRNFPTATGFSRFRFRSIASQLAPLQSGVKFSAKNSFTFRAFLSSFYKTFHNLYYNLFIYLIILLK